LIFLPLISQTRFFKEKGKVVRMARIMEIPFQITTQHLHRFNTIVCQNNRGDNRGNFEVT
jgi:hypothetical protein